MGCHPNITASTFPRQASWLGKRVVCGFHYDTDTVRIGVIVRDDAEDPNLTIIKLDPGPYRDQQPERYILASECQYKLADWETP